MPVHARRYLAGGSYLDITDNFGVSDAQFFRSVWTVITAINETLHLAYPRDMDSLNATEEGNFQQYTTTVFLLFGVELSGFAARSRGGLRGCVGALDGLLVKVVKPSLKHQPK